MLLAIDVQVHQPLAGNEELLWLVVGFAECGRWLAAEQMGRNFRFLVPCSDSEDPDVACCWFWNTDSHLPLPSTDARIGVLLDHVHSRDGCNSWQLIAFDCEASE